MLLRDAWRHIKPGQLIRTNCDMGIARNDLWIIGEVKKKEAGRISVGVLWKEVMFGDLSSPHWEMTTKQIHTMSQTHGNWGMADMESHGPCEVYILDRVFYRMSELTDGKDSTIVHYGGNAGDLKVLAG